MAFEWEPTAEYVDRSQLRALMREQGLSTVADVHRWSVENPDFFWERTIRALGVRFAAPYDRICEYPPGARYPRWLSGAQLNIADSCFARQCDRVAVITRRENGRTQTVTFRELEALSNRVANGLVALGLDKGDAIAICMSMTVEAVAIYLGIVKLGGVIVSIPDSFAGPEITKRLRIGNAKAVFTQRAILRCGKTLPLYERLCDAQAPKTIVLENDRFAGALRSGDVCWDDLCAGQGGIFSSVPCGPEDAISILFSSGTTAEPKAIPWDHTTPIKCASDAHYHHDIQSSDVVCWPTNLGWMMGPWLIFGSFLNGATIALYEGTPVERGFCEFVQEARVTMLGVVPSIVKAWRKEKCAEGLDWTCIRTFSSSGEASHAADYGWLMELNQPAGTRKPIIEYCGGTELGGGYATSNLLTLQRPTEFNGKTMGIDFVVLQDDGQPCAFGEAGEVFITAPSIGTSTRLLNADNFAVFYQGCDTWNGHPLRRHGDRMQVLASNCFRSVGRADDAMNLGGIKVSAGDIERVIGGLRGIVDVAAVGIPPVGGGPDRLVIYAVVDRCDKEKVKSMMQTAIKQHLNPLFHIHDVIVVDALPRTASNKRMHRILRDRYRTERDGQ